MRKRLTLKRMAAVKAGLLAGGIQGFVCNLISYFVSKDLGIALGILGFGLLNVYGISAIIFGTLAGILIGLALSFLITFLHSKLPGSIFLKILLVTSSFWVVFNLIPLLLTLTTSIVALSTEYIRNAITIGIAGILIFTYLFNYFFSKFSWG